MTTPLVTITLNGTPAQVPAGSTILQALQSQGLEVPVFCYHPRLKIAGNCRMCLVEVANIPKPVPSCATVVAEGMAISTQSPMVKESQQGALEFLLLNHPLDCPVCDQGGECDLQDLTLHYGCDHGRSKEDRRQVTTKPMGPLINTVMTRCIHCTRCIRFSNDIAGVQELGAFGRGEHMEVATYVEQAVTSELSGNLIDLCPVGALTSKPEAFKARPWELKSTPSIDVMDALGSHIDIDTRDHQVMRIRPRECASINQEWISDRTRFSCDGLRYQRLDQPYIRQRNTLVPCSWSEALAKVAQLLKKTNPRRMGALAGDLADAESLFLLGRIWDACGSPHKDGRPDSTCLTSGHRSHYVFNTTLDGIEQADFCLLIGTNPRWEAPLLNTRLRQRVMQGTLKVALLGPRFDLTYPYEHLGDHPSGMTSLPLPDARHPMVIVGQQPLCRKDGWAFFDGAYQWLQRMNGMREDWNGWNVLHTAAGRVGALDLGWTPGADGWSLSQMQEAARQGDLDLVYLLGMDNLDWYAFKKTNIIYQGHHGDQGAQHADVILPGAAYTEKTALYVNTEGRIQSTQAAVPPPGQAWEDWRILQELERRVHQTSVQTLEQLREEMHQSCKAWRMPASLTAHKPKKTLKFLNTPLKPFFNQFYMTNIISQHSPTMAQCVQDIGPLIHEGGVMV